MVEREGEADIQIDVVVNDEGTDGENTDEHTETYTRDDATADRIDFGVEHGDHHDADQDGDHAVRHDFHHAVLRSVNIGIFHKFRFHLWDAGEQGEAENEVGDGGAERCVGDVGIVHGLSSVSENGASGFYMEGEWVGKICVGMEEVIGGVR